MAVPQIAHEQGGPIIGPTQPTFRAEQLLTQKKEELEHILESIAFCESGGRQFDKAGNPLRGKQNPKDIGKYQINEFYWGDEAKRLGHDLATELGNEAMAKELYRRMSTSPWNSSKQCWNKKIQSQAI